MAGSSALRNHSHSAENLQFSATGRDHRQNSKPMIRKALAAMLGALLVQATFGPVYAQLAAAHSEGRLSQFGKRSAPSNATAEALQRAAPVTPTAAVTLAPGTVQAPPGSPLPAPPSTDESPSCPRDMVLVEGAYCSDVLQSCARWLDDPALPFARCNEYQKPSRCIGTRSKLRFCIDRYEYTAPGQDLPLNYQSFQRSAAVCEKLGKRLCTESEWTFACEGEEMLPYPYGFTRSSKCNQDRDDLYEANPHRQILADRRERADARPECVSPFGVYNMVGNLDESVLREGREHIEPFRNALKGGWWMPARNRCRPATTAHDDYYNDIQVGTRCCSAASAAREQL